MIRTGSEAAFLSAWCSGDRLMEIADARSLTTARFEPIMRSGLGYGQVDLLFEQGEGSAVAAGLLVDSNALLTFERRPVIWPARLAAVMAQSALVAIEDRIVPWLRSLARGRPMCREAIRRFAPSSRFDRARALDLPGAAPLDRSLVALAPALYARRFAVGERVRLTGERAFFAWAALADVAAAIECREPRNVDEAFVRDWFALPVASAFTGEAALLVADRRFGAAGDIVEITLPDARSAEAAIVDVPALAPWDLMLTYDRADAPPVSQFTVRACEPLLRPRRIARWVQATGGSRGTIGLALGAQSAAMDAADAQDAAVLGELCEREGLTVRRFTSAGEAARSDVDVMHIFGSSQDAHVAEFAALARSKNIPYVFDLPPQPTDDSGYVEKTFATIYRAANDDQDLRRFLAAYGARCITANVPGELSAQERTQRRAAFSEFAADAAAILVLDPHAPGVAESVGSTGSRRLIARGALLAAEPDPAAIGHIVPRGPFALVTGPLTPQSHTLFAALALETARIPFVIAGTVYDVDYLQTLRLSAPSGVLLADPSAGTVAALYRCAHSVVDAAPRPLSVAGLVRAVGCGALPILAEASPLVAVAGPAAPTFSLRSVECAANALTQSWRGADREARLALLAERLGPAADVARSFAAVLGAYVPGAAATAGSA